MSLQGRVACHLLLKPFMSCGIGAFFFVTCFLLPKHVSGLAGLGEHVFITAIGLNQRMFWLK